MTDTMITTFLTFAAFMLAFFAFIKRIIAFRLHSGRLTMKGLFIVLTMLAVVALLFLIFNSISAEHLENLFLYLLNLSHNSTYTSTLANIYAYRFQISDLLNISWNATLVSIILYLFYKIIKPVCFAKNDAKIYFNECKHIIASGSEMDMMQLANEVTYSIHDIFQSAITPRCRKNEYAIQLVYLFSDEMFCTLIIKHNPIMLHHFFEAAIKNCNIDFGSGKQLVRRLIGLLLTENQSLLNREEPYFGLGGFGTFKKLIFGNYEFLTSRYSPLSGWRLYCDPEVNSKAIKKYFEVIEHALQSYLENYSEKGDIHPAVFLNAMNEVGDIIKNSSIRLRDVPDGNVYALPDYKILTECSLGVGSLITFVRTKGNLLPVAPDILKKDYSFFKNDNNIYGALANGIFESIKNLSICTRVRESVRLLLHEIFFNDIYNPDLFQPIAERIELLLIEKMDQKLTSGFYPAVTANLIYWLGLCEPDKAVNALHRTLLSKLKSSFIKLHTEKPKTALDMLPADTIYDATSKKLIRKHDVRWERYGKTEELQLDN